MVVRKNCNTSLSPHVFYYTKLLKDDRRLDTGYNTIHERHFTSRCPTQQPTTHGLSEPVCHVFRRY